MASLETVRRLLSAAGTLLLAAAAPALASPIVPVSQDRQVQSSVSSPLFPSDPTPEDLLDYQNGASASDFGLFDVQFHTGDEMVSGLVEQTSDIGAGSRT